MRRNPAKTSINAQPTGSADARQMLGTSSAGVTTAASSAAYSIAGQRISSRKPTASATAKASKKVRSFGPASVTSIDIRMCSLRRNATTAPSMASHRNRMEASSSDQVNGRWNT